MKPGASAPAAMLWPKLPRNPVSHPVDGALGHVIKHIDKEFVAIPTP